MSRFIESLTKLHKPEPQPLGFATSGPAKPRARLPVAVILGSRNLDKILENVGEVEGVLVRVTGPEDLKAVQKTCQDKDNPPAGGLVTGTQKDLLEEVSADSCDFVVLPIEAPVRLSEQEKLGRILQVDPGLSEALLRTIGDLPIDAALFSPDWSEKTLSLADLMTVRRLALLISKPILLVVPPTLSQSELQALWDLGVSGLVVDVPDAATSKKLGELRKNLDKLSLPSLRRKDKVSPILPRLAAETAPPVEKEDDGEEEEDF